MAEFKVIELDENEDPSFVTVRMSIQEAAFITTVMGKQSGESADELMPGGGEASRSLWNAFTGGLFNRWYDGGFSEYLRDCG
jgi:hypothetical protein